MKRQKQIINTNFVVNLMKSDGGGKTMIDEVQ